jgi:hypothetical protein
LFAANPVGKVLPPEVKGAVEAARRETLEAKDTVPELQAMSIVEEMQEVMQLGRSGQTSTQLGRRTNVVSFRVANPASYTGATLNQHSLATSLAGSTFRVQASQ